MRLRFSTGVRASDTEGGRCKGTHGGPLGVLSALLLFASTAAARNPEGALDIIQTPNNGIPVIVTPGGEFDAILAQKASLKLVGPQDERPLDPEWGELPGGRLKAHCAAPEDIAPGCYALEAAVGDRVDRNSRSVFVIESFPESYTIAHITDTHMGAERGTRRAVDTFREILTAVNRMYVDQLNAAMEARAADEAAAATQKPESHAAGEKETPPLIFAVITGDLTHSGAPEEFRSFVDALDTCVLPTFVCPGNHDRSGLNYEKTFGPVTYYFAFGKDGFLSFDTKDFNIADELGPQDADLEVFRRAMAPLRWAIGFAHRYDPEMGIRSQLILFVDDPLDFLLFGHTHHENQPDEKAVPWGTTAITITPAGVDGALRLVHVNPYRIVPDKVEYPGKTN